MWTRAELKERAKNAFKSNYWKSVIAGLVMAFTAGGVGGSVRTGGQAVGTAGGSTTIDIQNIDPRVVAMICAILATIAAGAFLVKLFLLNPLSVGASRFFVKNSERPDASLNEVAEGFKNNYLGVVFTMFLKDLFLFFWAFLFIIPAIVKSYSYMMVPFILAEHPEISGTDAISLSRRMMDGEKWKAFVLGLSFLGWVLVSVITCMVAGVLWTNPYIYATNAELYRTLKHKVPELGGSSCAG